MLIDVHVHMYPPEVAGRIKSAMVAMDLEFEGTADADGYLKFVKEGLVDLALVNEHVANQRLVPRANNFIAQLVSENPDRLMGMAVVGRPDDLAPRELSRCIRELQFVGLKFHGAVVGMAPTEAPCMELWKHVVELGIPVLAHGGPHQEEMYRHVEPHSLFECEPAAPGEWLPVLREFPDLKLVLAHLGGAAWYRDDLLALLDQSANVRLDTALWYLGMRDNDFVSFVRTVGADRIMFGTDHPGAGVRVDVERFWNLPLTEEESSLIGWRNAADFFSLPVPGLDTDA